jgi:4-alpha-glucanotransferase
VDHILGFFRGWWVPAGMSPAHGAYVRYPANELLDILALESQRASAVVVGEDLGTVEAGVRAELARRRVLSSRLLWFEATPPRRWPRRSLAAVATHDLPTIAGVWTGAAPRDQVAAGKRVEAGMASRLRQRLRRATGMPDATPVADLIVRTHVALAEAPSHLVVASLEDACAAERQPNMPGTVDSWPNWRIPLPLPLEQLRRAPLPRRIAAALARNRSG